MIARSSSFEYSIDPNKAPCWDLYLFNWGLPFSVFKFESNGFPIHNRFDYSVAGPQRK